MVGDRVEILCTDKHVKALVVVKRIAEMAET
jgi:hypothetical protein